MVRNVDQRLSLRWEHGCDLRRGLRENGLLLRGYVERLQLLQGKFLAEIELELLDVEQLLIVSRIFDVEQLHDVVFQLLNDERLFEQLLA